MRVQHNISAINAHRNLMGNNNKVGKSLEKLSSGYRVNRAGDDAAGLAISEKMRAQISCLTQAETNCNDGISLIQTAEGALTEVHSMLNRMVELAEQSANGTYDNETDRANLQAETEELKAEIDRISKATNFNGINLLDGSLAAQGGAKEVNTIIDGTTSPLTAGNGATFTQDITLKVAGTTGNEMQLTLKYLDKDGNSQNATISYKAGADLAATAANAAAELQKVFGDGYTVAGDGTTGKISITANDKADDQTRIITADEVDLTANGTPASATIGAVTEGKAEKFTITGASYTDVTKKNFIEVDGTKYQILTRGQKAENDAKALYIDQASGALSADSVAQIVEQLKDYGVNASVGATNTNIEIAAGGDSKGGLKLQIGDTSDKFNQLNVSISAMDCKNLKIQDVSVADQPSADVAVKSIKEAINSVSSTRGQLGAWQNRLEHTVNNLSVTNENMTAAESRIRDTDMAKEMMAYTKMNILSQAAQSMLAQANQQPQQVLSLLQ